MRGIFAKALILVTIVFAAVYVPVMGADSPNRYIDFVGTYERTVSVGNQSAFLVDVDEIQQSLNLPDVTDRKVHVFDQRFTDQCGNAEAATVDIPLPGERVHVTGSVTLVGGLIEVRVACSPSQITAKQEIASDDAASAIWPAIRPNWMTTGGSADEGNNQKESGKDAQVHAAQTGIVNPVKFRGTVMQSRVPCPPTAICAPTARVQVEQILSGGLNASTVDVIIPPAQCSGGEAQVSGLTNGNRVEVFGGLENQGGNSATVDASCAPAYVRDAGSSGGGGGDPEPPQVPCRDANVPLPNQGNYVSQVARYDRNGDSRIQDAECFNAGDAWEANRIDDSVFAVIQLCWRQQAVIRSCAQRGPSNQPPNISHIRIDPSNPRVNQSVSFDVDVSDPDGDPIRYQWSFGDGTSDSGLPVSHRYTAPGSYTVTLTVRDGHGHSATADRTIRVQGEPNRGPTADFSWRPSDPEVGETVNFQDQSSDDERIESWNWEFGDGAQSSRQNPSHRYSSGRSFQVCLTVTDNAGATDTECRSVNVSPEPNEAPNADFTWNPINPIVNQPAEYTDQSTDSDGRIVSWNWEFPDGSTSSERNPTHRFDSVGTYRVCLTVRDNDGATNSTCEGILVVDPNQGPNADFTWQPSAPQVGESVNFQDQSSDPDGRIISHSWDFGGSGTSQRENPTHTFDSATTYSVCLTVEDDDQRTDEECQAIRVESEPTEGPDARIEATPRSGQAPLRVEFSATGSSDPDGQIRAFNWDFGDGNSASGETVSHTYRSAGSYTVQLTVRDNDGLTDTASTTIEVSNESSGNAFCTVQSISAPDSVEVGESGNLSATIVNNGDSAGRCSYQLLLSSIEPSVNYAPRECIRNCRRLEPGESFSLQANYTFDKVTEYRFLVTAAAEPENGDPVQEDQSTKSKTIKVSGSSSGDAFCTVQSISAPDSVEVGESGTLSATISNTGEAAGTCIYSLWIRSDDPHVSEFPKQCYSRNCRQLEPGESFSVETPYTFDHATEYSYIVTASAHDSQTGDSVQENESTKYNDIEVTGSSEPISADFMALPENPEAGSKIEFYDTSTPKDQVSSWKWSFDNGETSSERHPVQTYQDAGTYEVCLEISTGDGQSDQACKDITVQGSEEGRGQLSLTDFAIKREGFRHWSDSITASSGDVIHLRYRINNADNSSRTDVVLGASLRGPDGNILNDMAHDKRVTARSGEHWYFREFRIPENALTGNYDVGFGLWDESTEQGQRITKSHWQEGWLDIQGKRTNGTGNVNMEVAEVKLRGVNDSLEPRKFDVFLKNSGDISPDGTITASLSTSDSNIEITNEVVEYDVIESGEVKSGLTPFTIVPSGSMRKIPFDLSLKWETEGESKQETLSFSLRNPGPAHQTKKWKEYFVNMLLTEALEKAIHPAIGWLDSVISTSGGLYANAVLIVVTDQQGQPLDDVEVRDKSAIGWPTSLLSEESIQWTGGGGTVFWTDMALPEVRVKYKDQERFIDLSEEDTRTTGKVRPVVYVEFEASGGESGANSQGTERISSNRELKVSAYENSLMIHVANHEGSQLHFELYDLEGNAVYEVKTRRDEVRMFYNSQRMPANGVYLLRVSSAAASMDDTPVAIRKIAIIR